MANIEKRTLLRTGGVMLIAVVAIALALYFWGAQSDTQQGEDTLAQIIQRGDIGQCDQIDRVVDGVNQRTVCRNNIALNLALINGDISQCALMDGLLVSIADCEFQMVHAKALKEESVNVCDEATIPEVRQQCKEAFVSQLALKREDSAVCEKVADTQVKNDCLNASAIEQMIGSRKGAFDCALFIGDDVQRDCVLYQRKGLVPCRFFESNLFSQACSRFSGI